MGQCSSSEATEVSTEVVFEYTGKGCSAPKDRTIVRFHQNVVEVKDEAFQYCKQLREVMFNGGLQKIGQYAFHNCTSLSSIKLPSTVIEIGEWAFYGCHNLSEVIFNDGLQKIGDYAFYDCASLLSITLPSTVTEIGEVAFQHCHNLREVIFNDGLQKIGTDAFYNCISLRSITFPSTVTDIGYGSFCGCSNLREVVFYGVPREIAKNAFINCWSLERFTFPTISARLDTLIQTGHWEEIENEVNEVRGVVERSGGELFVSTRPIRGNNWNTVRRDIEKIVRLVIFYESQLPLLDIAFTDACDIGVLGPVKDKVLQYLI